jgi:predicted alpha/beta superfamily hydrolase
METVKLGTLTKIHSEILGETREILVRLPESYHGSNKIYPVLYMLDANYTPFFVNDVFTIEYMKYIQQVPEFIIVGIYNTNRDRDMIPVKIPERDSGGAEQFLEFIEKELTPVLNQKYRTSGYNMLYGASNAGIFGIYATFKTPDLFDVVIAPSPMIGWCPELIKEMGLSSFRQERSTKLYMIYGKQDYAHVTEHIPWFTEFLKENAPDGFKWACKYLEDEGHVPFPSLYEGFRWVFSKPTKERCDTFIT